MKVLVVGGSGLVGTMVMPYLKEEHVVRVFDLVAPREASVEYVKGSVNDPPAVRAARTPAPERVLTL